MYLLPIEREQLIECLPQGGVIAELGVFTGEFSAKILEICRPKKLHLIDPWKPEDSPLYRDRDYNTVAEHEKRYQSVIKRFEREIASGQVEVHRATSEEMKNQFSDAYFDWIYVDGLHQFEPVFSDLKNYEFKVKPNGYILGDDFTNSPLAISESWGVIEAVETFTRQSKFKIAVLTHLKMPNYVLVREDQAQAINDLSVGVLSRYGGVIELPDRLGTLRFSQRPVTVNGQMINQIVSFDLTPNHQIS